MIYIYNNEQLELLKERYVKQLPYFKDDQGLWFHNPYEGDNFTISHGPDKNWSFCKLQGPFAKDNLGQLHISFPKDLRHPDLTRYTVVRRKPINK